MKVSLQMLEEKKKLYESLQKEYDDIHYREELYRVAISLVNHSVSVVDIKKHSLQQAFYDRDWTGGVSDMENVPESIIANGIVHEDSIETYRNMFNEIYDGKPEGTCIIRAKDKKGVWSWLNVSFKTLLDQEGKPARAICYSENVTKKREAEQMLEQFMEIVDKKSDFSYQVNLTQDKILKFTDDSLHMLGVEVGMSYTQLHKKALEQVVKKFKKMISGKFERSALMQKFYEGERDIIAQYEYMLPGSNQSLWLEAHMYLLMNTDSEVCGILSARNIEAQKVSEQERNRKAQFDQLCPVLKRDVFEQELLSKLEKKQDLVLLMIDVDKFKEVNDIYGHTFGDEVLLRVSETINGNFRKTDVVARYGGDEFCVIMAGKFEPQVLKNSADHLIENVRKLVFDHGYHASLSIGAVQWNRKDSMKNLFEKADNRLYEAKNVRGRCSIWMEDYVDANSDSEKELNSNTKDQ